MLTFKDKLKWVYGIGGAFALLIGVLVYFEVYYVAAIIPIFLAIAGLAIFRLDYLLYLIVFCTPLSLNMEKIEFGLGLILPTEPLMFGAMLVFLLKLFYDHRYDPKVFKHPVTIAVLFHLVWMGITVLPSEMPVVSLKAFVSRMWFVIPFFFIAALMFKEEKAIHRFLWLFMISLAGVVVYTLYQHGIRDFEEKPAHWVMQPFFKDHTSYGAILAFFIPVVVGYLFNPGFRFNLKFMAFILFAVITIGIVFSYTRAAWVSIGAAFAVYLLIIFRARFSILVTMAVAVGIVLFMYRTDIMIQLQQNKQDSSGDFAEHVQSMSNVATDASNLERINRWKCALRMFEERPVFGFGPGTFMFQYAPFQHSTELTVISTNFGDLGNAHSEYLGPLAEEGLLGMLGIIAITIAVYVTAIPLYYKMENKRLKIVLLTCILGLTTYFTHGFLNNFLSLDKASVPFWGFIAVIVAVDVYHRRSATAVEADGK